MITVPNPCNENWNSMSPQNQGRFCSSCQLVVTDFTKMDDQEIIHYFRTHQNEKICGHFRNEQLTRMKITITPAQLQNHNWSIIQQIRIAIFLVFASSLFSCSSSDPKNPNPEILIQQSDSLQEIKDTNNASESGTIGKIIAPSEVKSKNISQKSSIETDEIKGEVEVEHNNEIIHETNGAALMEFDSIVKQPK
jgi:hypothetical protein